MSDPCAVPELTAAQRELAEAYGVTVDYEDWMHRPVTAPTETVLAVLAALGLDISDPAAAQEALVARRAQQRHEPLPPCIVVTEGKAVELALPRDIDGYDGIEAWVELEHGGRIDVTRLLVPGDLPLGYHRLVARWSGSEVTSTLVVTPAFLGFPDRLGTDRAWGFATQLYSVRSKASWGVGDLADLRDLAAWSGSELGADYLLVNPLSAAEVVAPMEPSPYLPSSRAFVNPLYLRVENIPEYDDLLPADRAAVDELRVDVHRRLNDLDAIDRDVSWAAKANALRLVHAVPRSADREAAYRYFVRAEGAALQDFATWCALSAVHGADPRDWPSDVQHPDRLGVRAFRGAHAPDVDFFSWLQWALDDQLAEAQGAALDAGMRLGVMHDLAVGVHPDGADAWVLQDALAQGISVGAPPDAFNQVGQNWSQPPWRPDRLAALGYRPYRDLISRLLRHSGALRIDHIIGLFRLWWIPEGATADRGTYVRYDHEALVGILALEAQRAGAVVVGEDLGVVEPFVRDYLVERGIIGTSILWFERAFDGTPLPASRWREYCLASVTTHDLPPTAGYLAGDHVELRATLDLLTRPVEVERADDEAHRASWLCVLVNQGVLAEDAGPEETVVALHRYLTTSPARLLCIALTDAVGDRRTQNQPGTRDEYPNWRIPLSGPDGVPMLLADVVSSGRVRRLAAAVGANPERPLM